MKNRKKNQADLLRRKIQKKVYAKQMKILNTKIKEIDEELTPFKRELIHSTTDIKFILQKLDYFEAEKISVKDSITLLSDRYKKGKLPSKAAFDRLSDDLLKRLSAAQKSIDRYVNELRAFTT